MYDSRTMWRPVALVSCGLLSTLAWAGHYKVEYNVLDGLVEITGPSGYPWEYGYYGDTDGSAGGGLFHGRAVRGHFPNGRAGLSLVNRDDHRHLHLGARRRHRPTT
jgi:hypothetical protein